MSNKKISQLEPAVDVTANDLFQVVDIEDQGMAITGTNKRITAQILGNFLPVTAAGSSASRTLKDRFADTVNVKDFGAVGDGVTDDTAAIQAAIDANQNKAIYFPAGQYKLTSQIKIKRSWTSLVADATGVAALNFASNTEASAILVRSDLAPTNPSIFGVNILNIRLTKTIQNTTNGAGIEFDRADGIRFINSEVAGFATALKVLGGRNNYFSDLRLAAYNAYGFDGIKATSIVEIASSTFSGGYTGFTQMFDNCIIGSDFTTSFAVSITGNDYCSFANCYISGATVAIVRITGGSGYVYDNKFDQCYFDGAKPYEDGPSPLGVWIQENAPSTNSNALQTFTACHFGQLSNAVYIEEQGVAGLAFADCLFFNIYESGIYCGSSYGDLRITGCLFRRVATKLADKYVIGIIEALNVVIASNVFHFESDAVVPTNTRVILLSSSLAAKSISITGNSFVSSSGNVLDFSNGSTSISSLTISGNASNNASNTIVGNVIGNRSNSNPLSLDWYEEGAFTPSISFGGGSTGVTYVNRTASATRIGNRVFFTIYIKLSSKGSSTGILEIGTLPYAVNTQYPSNYTISCGSLNTGTGDSNIDATPALDENKIYVRKQTSGTAFTLTDSDVTDTSNFNITGSYQVA